MINILYFSDVDKSKPYLKEVSSLNFCQRIEHSMMFHTIIRIIKASCAKSKVKYFGGWDVSGLNHFIKLFLKLKKALKLNVQVISENRELCGHTTA